MIIKTSFDCKEDLMDEVIERTDWFVAKDGIYCPTDISGKCCKLVMPKDIFVEAYKKYILEDVLAERAEE